MTKGCKMCKILSKFLSESEALMVNTMLYRTDKWSDYALSSWFKDVLGIEISHDSIGYHRKMCMSIPKEDHTVKDFPLEELIYVRRRC